MMSAASLSLMALLRRDRSVSALRLVCQRQALAGYAPSKSPGLSSDDPGEDMACESNCIRSWADITPTTFRSRISVVVKNSATSSVLPGSVGAVAHRRIAPSQASRSRVARFETIRIEFRGVSAAMWRPFLSVAPRRRPVLTQGNRTTLWCPSPPPLPEVALGSGEGTPLFPAGGARNFLSGGFCRSAERYEILITEMVKIME